MNQAQELEASWKASVEALNASAERLSLDAEAELNLERARLAEARREIDVLMAAAGAEKDSALAALMARRVINERPGTV